MGSKLNDLSFLIDFCIVNCFITDVIFPCLTGVVGATNMNATSSRSHAIFTVTIECSDKGPDGKQRVRVGKLHLVDLAVSVLLSNQSVAKYTT